MAASLLSEFGEATSFVSPELLRVGSDTIERYIAADAGLEKHAFNLRNTLRQEPHTLSDEAEQVLAATGPVVQGPERIYAMLSSSDMPFQTVTLSSGEEVRLDQAGYSLHRASPNRADRKLVFRYLLEDVEVVRDHAWSDARHPGEGARVSSEVPEVQDRAPRRPLRTEYSRRGLSHVDRRRAPASAVAPSILHASGADA